jgi:glycosyltransferase involved in cell wall biosynthesis
MHSADLISIVVTTYNRSDALAQVVLGLAQQDDKDFEIVIADDGSRPEHQAAMESAIERAGLVASHVWHPDVGFTASRVRNLGVAACRGSYLVFLDGDCVPETDFVRRHRLLREQGYFVNGSRVLLSEKLTRTVIASKHALAGRSVAYWVYQRVCGGTSKLSGLLRLPDSSMRRKSKFMWKGIRSCNMGVWREDYLAVNGFDESFVGWGHEDADFVLRLHNLGVKRKNGFCATEVYHLWHRESDRARESANAQKVNDRTVSGTHWATSGYRESLGAGDVVTKRLG